MSDVVPCKACDHHLPLVWSVQERRTVHLAQGLSTTPCARIDALEQQKKRDAEARAIANDRGNEDQRGR